MNCFPLLDFFHFLHQDYEARLFRVNKKDGEMVISAEEAIVLRKKKSALNRFYWNLSQQNKNSTSSDIDDKEMKRDVQETIVVCNFISSEFCSQVDELVHLCS